MNDVRKREGNGGEVAEMTRESNWEETKSMTGDSDCAI